MNVEEVKTALDTTDVEKKAAKKKADEVVTAAPSTPKNEYKWEAERLRDRKPVKGVFRFHEVPGGTLSFSFLKYKGDPIDKHDLKDGEVYTLPLGVARHLRTSGWYPVHAYAMNEAGVASKRIGQKVKRYTFEPLDFIADEEFHRADNEKQILTVTSL
jgi:hypothetical protein